MSKLSKDVDILKRRIVDAEARLSYMNNNINNKVTCSDIVTCEVCGCAIKIGKAIKGKGIVKTEIAYYIPPYSVGYAGNGGYYVHAGDGGGSGGGSGHGESKDYIYYPYYCKLHAPKELTEEGKKEEDNYDNGR
jgi:hypothetical protein